LWVAIAWRLELPRWSYPLVATAVVGLLALVGIAGLDVLFSGVFRGIKPTLNALTH
jgi:hypothetical protein